MQKNRILSFLFFLTICVSGVFAQDKLAETMVADTIGQPTDTVVQSQNESLIMISLLTCDPGDDAYKMFGHTAIRVNDQISGRDIVYNYGVFDSRRKKFIYNFIKGETDYALSRQDFIFFKHLYNDEYKLTIYEQPLNLTPTEAETLQLLLEINALPENKTYRYNFLYDNCTTRAIRKIEEAYEKNGRKVVYKPLKKEDEDNTFRDILHTKTEPSPWMEFGIDFLLGTEVDCTRDQIEQMFIPDVLMNEADKAVVINKDGKEEPLVGKVKTYAPPHPLEIKPLWFTPMMCFSLLFLLVALLCFFDFRRKKLSVWADIIGIFARGVAGFLIAFLFFFSEHPAVGSNLLVIAFNPLYFIMIPNILFSVSKKRFMAGMTIRRQRYDIFELVNLAVLVFTMLLFVLPIQQLNIAMLPLVLTLLIRSLTRIYVLRHTVNW